MANNNADSQHHAREELQVQYVDIDKLIPYINNARTHSKEQIAQIAASIKEFGFTTPILIDEDNVIIAGHGRLDGARQLQLTQVPTIQLSELTEAQKKAYILADNRLAQNAGWDEDLLKLELSELEKINFDLELTGFDIKEISSILDDDEAQLDSAYTNKIEIPNYQITGEKPKLEDLYDNKKTKDLVSEIEEADIPSNIKQFLKIAAERHTVFNFREIAEYYAHCNADIQNLFERSALVIIDFKQAVENAYIETSKYLGEFADEDNEE
tara:strand:- start:543 stop:1349 length:807 start_codon:yes stop_codon:yes gene_type:complete